MCELAEITVTTVYGFAKKPDFKPGDTTPLKFAS